MKFPVICHENDSWMHLEIQEAGSREAAVLKSATRWVETLKHEIQTQKLDQEVRIHPEGVTGTGTPNVSVRVQFKDSDKDWVIESVWTVPDIADEKDRTIFQN